MIETILHQNSYRENIFNFCWVLLNPEILKDYCLPRSKCEAFPVKTTSAT